MFQGHWYLSILGATVLAFIIAVGSFFLPNTPNSLIKRGQHDKAKAILQRIRGLDNVEKEFDDLVKAIDTKKKMEHYPWRNLLQRKYRPHLSMAILIPFFQQFTGSNVILFYAPIMLKNIGLLPSPLFISTLFIGFVNVCATVVSIYGVDKWGRRFFFIEGGIQMFISQVYILIF